MIQEQIFSIAVVNNPFSMIDNPTQAGAFHDGFEQGVNFVRQQFVKWCENFNKENEDAGLEDQCISVDSIRNWVDDVIKQE